MPCHATTVAATPLSLVFGPNQAFGPHSFLRCLFALVLRRLAWRTCGSSDERIGRPRHTTAWQTDALNQIAPKFD
jgi:hypothetical protein